MVTVNAPVKRHKPSVLLFLPLLAFLALAFPAMDRASEGPWQQKSLELWSEKKWKEVIRLADNLNRTNRPDPRILLMAASASRHLSDENTSRTFVQNMLQLKFLNWTLETEAGKLYRPATTLEFLRLYRSRAFVAVLVLTIFLLALFLMGRHTIRWTALITAAGCAILIL